MNEDSAETIRDPQSDLIASRREALLKRWSQGGRLSKSEFEEIRELIAGVNSSAQTNSPGGPIANAHSQSPEPAAPGRVTYQKDLIEYSAVYGTSDRQIKRWIAAGKTASPPELPPLDEPKEMSAWWARHMKQRVPAKLIMLARNSSAQTNSPAENASIDISDLETAAGDAVRQAAAYLAAADRHLSEAYKSGNDARIEICQRRWLKAIEAKRKAEFAAREDLKIKGDLIPKAELLPALSQLLEVMRQMRQSARRRILARFEAKLSSDLAEELGLAIEAELARGDAVLRSLKQFRSFEEIDQFELQSEG